ncbi:DUF3598 family protein [Yinghuangia seranimata]|uniref:DUF3598 family protein n=1 Tax=Yinghuangia seranimata TaxID=408067 RepID=UPI00248AEF29|nr:DUF3598 family protein [Yinghuangia seranimata]MDI2132439.1 DUF3598 family protein [Yinghuangia seranimata]
MGIREGMPLLAKHEGDWEGTYTYVDPEGKIIDQHRSHLTCAFPADSEYPYHQTNTYTWPDGRTEVHEFPGTYDGYGRMHFDTERIKGVTWGLDENTIYLTWIYKEKGSDLRLFELIVLSDDGNHRSRTWQWLRDGKLEMRTLINETRVSAGAAAQANPFGEQIIAAVVDHMNLDHPEDSLLIVRSLGQRPEATSAETVGLDGEGIDFKAVVGGAEETVRVPWSAPISERPQIRVEVTRMYYDACAALGVEPRPAEEH